MPGAANPIQASETEAEDGDTAAEKIPLLLPSSLDPVRRKMICLQQVAEHEQLLRLAQLQDSLTSLRNTRRVRRKLTLNHRTQIAGQGQRANTRSRAVMNSVQNRIDKFVERYRATYKALLQLDPTGDWRRTFLELKDCDNRGPGKEAHEEGLGDGSYFRSWIWLANPQVADTAAASHDNPQGAGVANPTTDSITRTQDTTTDNVPRATDATADNVLRAADAATNNATQAPAVTDVDEEEEGATQEEVNDFLRVEWTTSFARLERWTEEVELLQEEMRRVVMFLQWRSKDWSAKVDVREDVAPDIRSGLNAYARKQAAIYHNLAVSFVELWYPTLESYGLEHAWVTEYAKEHNLTLPDTLVPDPRARGIFKFKLSNKSGATATTPPKPTAKKPTNNHPLLAEADSDDSCLEDGDSDSEFDWEDDS